MHPDQLPPALQTVIARVVKAERRRADRRAEDARKEVYAALGEVLVKSLPGLIGGSPRNYGTFENRQDDRETRPDPLAPLLKSAALETPADVLERLADEEGVNGAGCRYSDVLRYVKTYEPWEYDDLLALVADELSLERVTKADRSHLVRKVIRNRLGHRQVVWVRPQQADAEDLRGQSQGQGSHRDPDRAGKRHMSREQALESRTILANALADPNRLNPEQVKTLVAHIDAVTKEEAKGMLRQLGQKVSGDQMAVAKRLLDAIRAGREAGKGTGDALRAAGNKTTGQYGAWGAAAGGGAKPVSRDEFPKRGVGPGEKVAEEASSPQAEVTPPPAGESTTQADKSDDPPRELLPPAQQTVKLSQRKRDAESWRSALEKRKPETRYGGKTDREILELRDTMARKVQDLRKAAKDGVDVSGELEKFEPRLAELNAEKEHRQEMAKANRRLAAIEDGLKTGKLTVDDEEMRQLLGNVGDAYKDAGYRGEYNPDAMRTSDLTGRKIRRYVELPDGRIAHPDELILAQKRGRIIVENNGPDKQPATTTTPAGPDRSPAATAGADAEKPKAAGAKQQRPLKDLPENSPRQRQTADALAKHGLPEDFAHDVFSNAADAVKATGSAWPESLDAAAKKIAANEAKVQRNAGKWADGSNLHADTRAMLAKDVTDLTDEEAKAQLSHLSASRSQRSPGAETVQPGSPTSKLIADRVNELRERLGRQSWQRTQAAVRGAEGLPAHKHRQAVEQALAAGKPVPPEVLADYPDLAAKRGGPTADPFNQPDAAGRFPSRVDGVSYGDPEDRNADDKAARKQLKRADKHAAEADRIRDQIDQATAAEAARLDAVKQRATAAQARVAELEQAARAAAERSDAAKKRAAEVSQPADAAKQRRIAAIRAKLADADNPDVGMLHHEQMKLMRELDELTGKGKAEQSPATAVDKPATAGNTTPVQPQSAGAKQGGGGMSKPFQYTINNPSSPLDGQTLTFRNKYKAPVGGEVVDVIEFEPITHNGKTYEKPIISVNKYPDAFEQHAAHEREQRAAKANSDAERQASLAAAVTGWADVKAAVDERINDGAQAFGRQGMGLLNDLRQKYPAAYLWHYADQQERTAHWSSTEKRERMQRVKSHIEAGDIEAATAELNTSGVKNPFTN